MMKAGSRRDERGGGRGFGGRGGGRGFDDLDFSLDREAN
jgi:small subunit ribosomal protein S6